MKSANIELQAQSIQNVASDISNVTLQLSQPFSLAGVLRCEGEKNAPPIRGHIVFMPGVDGGSVFLGTAHDGQFAVDRMYPGAYRVQAAAEAAPGCYLSSVTLDGHEVLGRRVEIASSSKVVVTFKRDGGSVRGTVEAPGAKRILLIPAEAVLRWPDLAFSTSEIINGRFEIASVRPGSYYAIALAGASEWTLLRGRELDRVILNSASSVMVKGGEATDVQLRSIYK